MLAQIPPILRVLLLSSVLAVIALPLNIFTASVFTVTAAVDMTIESRVG